MGRSEMTAGQSPTVYVIAGPNGAGKTTFATEFLPTFVQCREYVNADLIAAGLSPFAPELQAMRAGRLLLTRIRELAEARQEFAFETTLAGRSYVKLIAEFRRSGYDVILFFLWLPSAEAAVARVATRVRQGGHDVPEETIRRRFRTGIRNFFTIYSSLVNSWHLYDGSLLPPRLIASRINGALVAHQPRLYNEIETQWEN
jgi:predicted ABC-type ATPase